MCFIRIGHNPLTIVPACIVFDISLLQNKIDYYVQQNMKEYKNKCNAYIATMHMYHNKYSKMVQQLATVEVAMSHPSKLAAIAAGQQ